ncbi:MAG: hypothetical protein WD928_02310 [Gammaproteobacteria bacterium]
MTTLRHRAHLRATAPLAIALALATPCLQTAAAADTLPPPTVEVGDVDDDVTRPAAGRVRTPAAGASTDSAKAADGPAVELITGGQSKDGAARVGRLPVLD